MRKIIMIMSTLALVSMLLVACGGQETATSAPATEFPTLEEATSAPTQETPVGTETGAGTQEGTGTPVGGIPVTGEEDPSRLSNELDYDVWNQSGDQIGEVDDMVIDLNNSMVAYVVVGTGGFLDIGEKEILVPWDQLKLQTGANSAATDQYAFILQADQQAFENAPDVDLNSVLPEPGQPANDWDAQLRDYWQNGVVPSVNGTPGTGTSAAPATDMNATPATAATDTSAANTTATPAVGTSGTTVPGANETGQLQGVVLATDLLGSTVTVGANGQVLNNNVNPGTAVGTGTPSVATAEPVGTAMPEGTAQPAGTATLSTGTSTGTEGQVNTATVDDVIVDINTGNIKYFVLSASFSDGDRLVPVPLSRFGWDAANGTYVLDVDSTMLNDAPYFQDGQYPDTTVTGWDADYSSYWQ